MYRYTVALLDGADHVIDWFGTNDGSEAMSMEDRFFDRADDGDKVVLKEGDDVIRYMTR